jgi:transposase-like protein
MLKRLAVLAPSTDPINVKRLAEKLGVTRQALYNNGIEKLVVQFRDLQQRTHSVEVEASSVRKPLEETIRTLREENAELRRKLDTLVQWWTHWALSALNGGVRLDMMLPGDRVSTAVPPTIDDVLPAPPIAPPLRKEIGKETRVRTRRER